MASVRLASEEKTFHRLPWLALLLGLVAMTALMAREGSPYSLLPILAGALVYSRFSARRFENASQVWMLRVPLFLIVVFTGFFRPFPDTSGLYDPRTICLGGELLAVEMTLQAYRQRPSGGGQGMSILLLSGLILLAAADSTEDRTIWFLTPLYTLCLALALPGFRSPSAVRSRSEYRRSPLAGIALGLALLFGAGMHLAFRVHRDSITEWGMQILHETAVPESGSGAISTTPSLGPSYGLSGSEERAYRIEGPRGAELPEHLRIMAFDTYAHSNWLPVENTRNMSAEAARRFPPVHPPLWRVTRLLPNDGVLVAPLEMAGFDALDQREVRWAPEMGPLKSATSTPSSYLLSVGPPGSQGPLCTPPDATERARLLALPQEMDSRVRDIAKLAGKDAGTPEEKADAVAAYLPAHHGYALSYRPKAGDPVSRFLLSSSPAHCEYFASAAVLLMRCLGVPARYVIGYYAHERDSGGQIVVRQRDAHAWAEAWIEGKGWKTVEATPGDGRPDKAPRVPWWTRINEWFGDSVSSLRARLGRSGILLVVLVSGVVGMFIAWRNRPRRKQPDGSQTHSYTISEAEFWTLATRFERLCQLHGLALPRNRTWEEALNATPESASDSKPNFDREAAFRFVRAYTASRWGGSSAEDFQQLRQLLDEVEIHSLKHKLR